MGDSKDGIGSDKEVDAMLSSVLSKVNTVKGSLSSLVGKMEHEHLTWPSVLDSFSSFSGHASNLMKQLGAERLPPLHTRVILPLMVSSEKDFELERQTEGRVPIMHHEVVPNYLRTKLGLELEAKQKERWSTANSKEEEEGSLNEIKKFNQMLSTALEYVREEEERKFKTGSDNPPSTSAETKKLVATYLRGTSLNQMSGNRRAQLSGATAMAASGAGVRLPMMARNTAMRAAARADQRQAVASPYLGSPHKHPGR